MNENPSPFVRYPLGEVGHGGLISTIDHKFDEFGFVDWRATIPQKFLFVNTEKFKAAEREVPETIEGVEDDMLLIKLGGIKWLARARGYEKVVFEVVHQEPSLVTVRCRIYWIPNFENPRGATYEELASCGVKNADELSLRYSESIAANRAFVRCVRNFLNVNIVGDEEIDKKDAEAPPKPSDTTPATIDPQSIYIKLCKEKGLDFKSIKERCVAIEPTMDDCQSEDDIIKNLTPKNARKLIREIKSVSKAE